MNIIVCFDGTWNQNETQNTNVHRLFCLSDPNHSISNYYPGVGVVGRFLGNRLDAMSGRGVFSTVRAAYTFVRGNFKENDRIFIFGFSRGAYAARHLAGMIARIAIKGPSNIEDQYRFYRRDLEANPTSAPKGKNYDVQFLGLFDCVPGNQIYLAGRSKNVNNPVLEPNIRNFAHAVSFDERRWSFKPLLFDRSRQQRFKQEFLPGYHSDVGGDGNAPLNDFALDWMLEHARKSGFITDGNSHSDADPSGPGRPSDWLPTTLGLRCIRRKLRNASLVGDPLGLREKTC